MYKLVLTNKGFPERFNTHKDIPHFDRSLSNKENMEKKVIKSFNDYNPKLNISKIEYVNLTNIYGNEIMEYTNSGLIVKEIDIVPTTTNQDHYINDGYIVNNNKFEKISAYVYISSNTEGRNTFVAQILFPSLIDQMNLYIDSPSFTLTNRPIYFLNLINKDYSTGNKYIPRHINYWQNTGVHIIDITQNITDYEQNKSLKEIASKRLSNYYNKTSKIYDYKYTKFETYTIDTENKILTLKKEAIVENTKTRSNGDVYFNGSFEKFYWAECIPLVILASRQNYTVDVSEYKDYIVSYGPRFGNSSKMKRCKWVLEYFEKIL